jgi:alanyl-tRNA synthetase
LEISAELFAERGQKIDIKQFQMEFDKHRDLSRTASKGMFKGGLQDHSEITTKYHTATHLLQQALRNILGREVRQKGSNITAERLRFDFSCQNKITPEQIARIEETVNKVIADNLPVTMTIQTIKDAVFSGALTIEGASYPDKVKVYSIGNFSKEVCGGPHVDFTGDLGKFKIVKEEQKTSGIRRIYAKLVYHVNPTQHPQQKGA